MNNHNRNKIIKIIKKERVVSSSDIAKELTVSWNTAQAYLMELALEGEILRIKKEGFNLWMLK